MNQLINFTFHLQQNIEYTVENGTKDVTGVHVEESHKKVLGPVHTCYDPTTCRATFKHL